MNIRESKSEHSDAIYRVHKDAFGVVEGEVVAQLARDTLVDKSAKPLLSLVAEDNARMIGNRLNQ